jgi:hypothetical protein
MASCKPNTAERAHPPISHGVVPDGRHTLLPQQNSFAERSFPANTRVEQTGLTQIGGTFLIAVFEAAPFALPCHFLRSRDLRWGQMNGNGIAIPGRSFTIFSAGS